MSSESVAPSPLWRRTMPPGPDARMKITEGYAKLVGADAFFWAWPLAAVYNRRLACVANTEIAHAGPVPSAPLNRLAMLTDYVAPEERIVACPNQDVVYGGGSLALEKSPVVMQVPDFGERFWVYQVTDTRTDSFVQLGSMYATTPGFYLLVGPDWIGDVPAGITTVFRSPTSTGFAAPRVFLDDTADDRQAVQSVLQFILMYPLAEYDGQMKRVDWNAVPRLPNPASGDEETKWVVPETFFDELADILSDAPPLPGEEARYAQVSAVLESGPTTMRSSRRWSPVHVRPMKSSSNRCCNSATTGSNFRTIGAPSPTNPTLASTISREPPWRDRTSSSTRRTRPSITTRIWTTRVTDSTEWAATPSRFHGVRHRLCMGSGHSRSTTSSTSLFPTRSTDTRWETKTKIYNTIRTAHSQFMYRPTSRPRSNTRTGCQRPRARTSRCTCGPTGLESRSPTVPGHHRP